MIIHFSVIPKVSRVRDLGYQLKAVKCGAKRRTLPLNFFAFCGKPRFETGGLGGLERRAFESSAIH